MNSIDWSIIGLLSISTLISAIRGAAKESLSLLVWLLSALIASMFHDQIEVLLINIIEFNTPVFLNFLFKVLLLWVSEDFKINLELFIFIKILDQVSTTSSEILLKSLNEPNVINLFFIMGVGYSFLNNSNPE